MQIVIKTWYLGKTLLCHLHCTTPENGTETAVLAILMALPINLWGDWLSFLCFAYCAFWTFL